jgi:hypothetical protein
VSSLEELNAMIDQRDREDDTRRIRGRVRTIGEHFVAQCGCGNDFRQSFYTAPKPDGAYGPGHRNVGLRTGIRMSWLARRE